MVSHRAILALLVAVSCRTAAGQSTDGVAAETGASVPIESDESAADVWAFSATASAWFVPDDRNYVQPTITLDHDWLHLEARHNYENFDTASAWIGFNFSFGEELTFDITPMVGGIFGDTTGIAPGYEMTLGWRSFEFYSEGEYVFDFDGSEDNYFYTWTELTYSPVDWLRAGIVIQRTRAYESDLDVQRGLLVGVTYDFLDVAAAVFNFDDSDPIVMLSVGVSFEF